MRDLLQNDKTDIIVSSNKSVVGVAPFIGLLLAELVGILIPNQ
jgi:hypothetical protein